MHLKMVTAYVVCYTYLTTLLDNVKLSIEPNSMNTDPAEEASKVFQRMTKADDLCCDWCFLKGLKVAVSH